MTGAPKRWLEDDSAPEGARALLAAAPGPVEMSDEAFERSTAAVGAIAAGAGAATGIAKILGSTLAKLGALVVISGTVAGAVAITVWAASPAPAPTPRTTATTTTTTLPTSHAASAADPALIGPAVGPAREAPEPASIEPLPTPPPRSESPPPASAPRELPEPLSLETRLLSRARVALADAPARALTLADRHARRFPNGQLWAERETIAVDALVRLGRRGDAQTRADRFFTQSPPDMYAGRVRRLIRH